MRINTTMVIIAMMAIMLGAFMVWIGLSLARTAEKIGALQAETIQALDEIVQVLQKRVEALEKLLERVEALEHNQAACPWVIPQEVK